MAKNDLPEVMGLCFTLGDDYLSKCMKLSKLSELSAQNMCTSCELYSNFLKYRKQKPTSSSILAACLFYKL